MKIYQKATIGLAAALVLAGGTTGIAVAANGQQTSNSNPAPLRAVAAVAAKAQKPASQPAAPATAPAPAPAPAPGATPISQDQAVQTALTKSPGTVLESAKLDAKDNYWEIDLKPGQGQSQHVDYEIDATTGAVRSVETDSKHTPAQEKAHQAKEQGEKTKEKADKAQEKADKAQEKAQEKADKTQEKSAGKHVKGKDD